MLNPEETVEMCSLLAESFHETFKGQRLRRILREVIGPLEIEIAHAAGTFHAIGDIPHHGSREHRDELRP